MQMQIRPEARQDARGTAWRMVEQSLARDLARRGVAPFEAGTLARGYIGAVQEHAAEHARGRNELPPVEIMRRQSARAAEERRAAQEAEEARQNEILDELVRLRRRT